MKELKMGRRCNIKFKELSIFVDGRCDERRKEFIQEHVSECSHCKEQLQGIRFLKGSLNELAPIEESSGFDFEFNRLLEARLRRRRPRIYDIKIKLDDLAIRLRDSFVSPVPVAVRVAASFLLVIAIGWGLRAQSIQRTPFVEFTAGDVKIYRPIQKAWITPTPDLRLRPGDKIRSTDGGILNIVSRDKFKARIKGESLIVISKLESGWRRTDTDFSISYGNLLVNTSDKFKGSKMNIYTPSCDAEVVGTAFIVEVFENRTWLGVLEGKVKLISKVHPLKEQEFRRIATFVSSGQKALIKPYMYPTVPELFSEMEWQVAQELYQLTEHAQIILLIGTGPNRVEELFKAATVYIPNIERRSVPRPIQQLIDDIATATRDRDFKRIDEYNKELEQLLNKYPNSKYNVEILMFIASHYHLVRDYNNALRVFEMVIKEYPKSSLASLAQCAIGTIYQQDLKDIRMAEKTYNELLRAYPDSVEAIRAKETLASLR
jgi:hypothetical protein